MQMAPQKAMCRDSHFTVHLVITASDPKSLNLSEINVKLRKSLGGI